MNDALKYAGDILEFTKLKLMETGFSTHEIIQQKDGIDKNVTITKCLLVYSAKTLQQYEIFTLFCGKKLNFSLDFS
ncbi:MAG: hypothetical protein FWC23_05090 [Chitinispirillia bacterium]|nr:hypothetical protein [Chitinispirillia bacterium]MCL2268543.1 hypothetical protein [Chitinispirillia bacterium]